MREWHHASRIALGWLLNQCAFVGMLCIYVVYGCAVRSLSAEDNSQVAGHAGPSRTASTRASAPNTVR